ncbi:hypothetical protein BFW01_g12837 [Lasiodiplodia theobromae]|nr:hypothetical protein BFW01_g12837 [Lasiodiplodia theobromae]
MPAINEQSISLRDNGSQGDTDRLLPPGLCLKTTIQVFAGEEPEPFIIHKDILCASSDFFKNACKEPWKESAGVVELSGTEPRLFEVYARWLYSPDVLNLMEKPVVTTAANGAISVPAYEPLFHLYALGDMLQDSKFKNAILDKIVEVRRLVNYHPICFSAFVYSELPPSSPLRRLYVDFWVGSSASDWFNTKNPADDCNSPDAPMEFFRDVLRQSKTGGAGKKPWEEDICQYHEHPAGIKCQK